MRALNSPLIAVSHKEKTRTARASWTLASKLKKFYFDLAISGTPAALPSLPTLARPDHLLFATDWTHETDAIAEMFTSMYEGFSLSESQRAAIDRSNAEANFPRLRGGLS